MNRMLAGIFLCAVTACAVRADVTTRQTDVLYTNGAISVSDNLPVGGYLDKIEVFGGTAGVTQTVTVASYSGDTIIDTIASITVLNDTATVARPGAVRTFPDGKPGITNALERIMIGGSTRIKVVLDGSTTNGARATVRLFYGAANE